MPQTPDAAGPLAGYLVIDLTKALAGPHASMMLGDLGARVIKVEPPQGDQPEDTECGHVLADRRDPDAAYAVQRGR